jgi:hypothetical protein
MGRHRIGTAVKFGESDVTVCYVVFTKAGLAVKEGKVIVSRCEFFTEL